MARGAMVLEMALQRTPIAPQILPPGSATGTGRLSSRALFSAKNWTHFDAFSMVLGGNKAQRQRAGVGLVHLRHTFTVCCARASSDSKEPQQSTFPPPGELHYFGKLSASCVAGALLVKYGSLCVPSVTTPNLNVALVMIFTPCLFSVALLTLASIFGSDGNTSKL